MKHSRRRVATIGGLALAAALAFTACSAGGGSGEADGGGGDGTELTPVKLQLQWLPQGQFAGYFAAQELGYFEEEGLDVEIIPSGGDIVPQDALANGDVDYAIAWVPKVLGSIEQGANLTNIAQIFRESGRCRSRGPIRASSRSPTSRARRSARGASATSGRSSRPWPRRASTRRPSRSSRRTST